MRFRRSTGFKFAKPIAPPTLDRRFERASTLSYLIVSHRISTHPSHITKHNTTVSPCGEGNGRVVSRCVSRRRGRREGNCFSGAYSPLVEVSSTCPQSHAMMKTRGATCIKLSTWPGWKSRIFLSESTNKKEAKLLTFHPKYAIINRRLKGAF